MHGDPAQPRATGRLPDSVRAGRSGPAAYVSAGYLEVTGMDEVTWRELTARRAWLLRALGSAEPGAEVPGIRAAALALTAVITEQDTRVRTYAAYPDRPYSCTCGFRCSGLAAIDEHLDEFAPGSDAHDEVAGTTEGGPAAATIC